MDAKPSPSLKRREDGRPRKELERIKCKRKGWGTPKAETVGILAPKSTTTTRTRTERWRSRLWWLVVGYVGMRLILVLESILFVNVVVVLMMEPFSNSTTGKDKNGTLEIVIT